MFILDVSVGVSVFKVDDWFFVFWLFGDFLCRLLCRRRASWRVARRRPSARPNCIWSVVLWLCARAGGRPAAPALTVHTEHCALRALAHNTGPSYAPLAEREASPSGRLAACRRGFPRCTRATPRFKPLRFWALGCMHWLMWTVTRFRFLSWSEAVSPGAADCCPTARSRLYLPTSHQFDRIIDYAHSRLS